MSQDFIHKSAISEHWLYWSFLTPDLLKKPLYTIDTQAIHIIDPGYLNYDNGPDIQNAILEIGGIIHKGDIEFHLNPEAWFKHGHHEDRRYQNIILHILWDAPQEIDSSLLRRFPHVILCHQLDIPFSDWLQKMNMLEQEGSWNRYKIVKTNSLTLQQLKKYGQIRFRRKVERLKCWLEQFSFEDTLFISLAEALGYSKNKFPFRQLLWENPPSKIIQIIPKLHYSVIGIWVYLAIRANLLTAQSFTHLTVYQKPIITKVYNLFTYYNEQGILPDLELRDWYFSRVRPVNNPIVRLAALAQIIYNYQASSFFKAMLKSAGERLSLKNLLLKFQASIQFPFNDQLIDAIQSLYQISIYSTQTIGITRARQFIINFVLPIMFLWAERSGNSGFQQYVEGLYEEFPACESTRWINHYQNKFSSPSFVAGFKKFAIYQQGLLEFRAEQQVPNLFKYNPERVNSDF